VGAILCGQQGTAVDVGGIEILSFRAVWTCAHACGLPLQIYGSEGWEFEILPACDRDPGSVWVSHVEVCDCCGGRLRILDDSLLVCKELPLGCPGRISERARDHDGPFQTL
jgi:hypothetical protein